MYNLSVNADALPPPLVGEALADRKVFANRHTLIANELSLPRAPLVGKTPPAGGGGTQVPKGERLSSECETERLYEEQLHLELIRMHFGNGTSWGCCKTAPFLDLVRNGSSRVLFGIASKIAHEIFKPLCYTKPKSTQEALIDEHSGCHSHPAQLPGIYGSARSASTVRRYAASTAGNSLSAPFSVPPRGAMDITLKA